MIGKFKELFPECYWEIHLPDGDVIKTKQELHPLINGRNSMLQDYASTFN